jgi:hypothetical protein
MAEPPDILSDVSEHFDENFYLRSNPDVAEAIRAGAWNTGMEHFVHHGRREGRAGSASDPIISGCGIMNANPLILHAWWWETSPFPSIEALSRRLMTTPLVLLISNAWSLLSRFTDGPEFMDFVKAYAAHKSSFPNHRIVFLANDALERRMLQWQGVEAVVFQHNGFYPRGRLQDIRRRSRDFDAVYVARIERYKRLELMAEIESGCIIFAAADKEYFKTIAGTIGHLTFVNGDPFTDAYRRLTPADVMEYCARSACGLCLCAASRWLLRGLWAAGMPILMSATVSHASQRRPRLLLPSRRLARVISTPTSSEHRLWQRL